MLMPDKNKVNLKMCSVFLFYKKTEHKHNTSESNRLTKLSVLKYAGYFKK
jgi:hypothetical protein